jgi:hypothetical protein
MKRMWSWRERPPWTGKYDPGNGDEPLESRVEKVFPPLGHRQTLLLQNLGVHAEGGNVHIDPHGLIPGVNKPLLELFNASGFVPFFEHPLGDKSAITMLSRA